MGAPRTATLHKILAGTIKPYKRRDDEAPVGIPAWSTPLLGEPTEAERVAFAELLAVLPALHVGAKDGHAIAMTARLYARVREYDAKLREFGPLMRAPGTDPPILQPSPYVSLARRARAELMEWLKQLGCTPLARLRLAQPIEAKPSSADEWAALD